MNISYGCIMAYYSTSEFKFKKIIVFNPADFANGYGSERERERERGGERERESQILRILSPQFLV